MRTSILKNMLLGVRDDAHDVVIDCFYAMCDSTDEDFIREVIDSARGISKLADEHLDTLLEIYKNSYW